MTQPKQLKTNLILCSHNDCHNQYWDKGQCKTCRYNQAVSVEEQDLEQNR